MRELDAARLLYLNGQGSEAESILRHLFNLAENQSLEKFTYFCALLEIAINSKPSEVQGFLDEVIQGGEGWSEFWEARTLAQQGVLFEWHGHLSYLLKDAVAAFDSLTRAASLGRDTSLLWFQLSDLFIDNGEFDLGIRYAKRSLQLFKQLDLKLFKGQEDSLGSFGGHHPLCFEHNLESYLELLLKSTRLARNQKNLRAVRELVVEMIHQFPRESRLPKIRLLIERNIVKSSVEVRA